MASKSAMLRGANFPIHLGRSYEGIRRAFLNFGSNTSKQSPYLGMARTNPPAALRPRTDSGAAAAGRTHQP